MPMEFEFDPAKDEANLAMHGVSLARARDFEIIRFVQTRRGDETRIRAFGLLDGKHYCLVFTFRPNAVRAISLRRAHLKEVQSYGQ